MYFVSPEVVFTWAAASWSRNLAWSSFEPCCAATLAHPGHRLNMSWAKFWAVQAQMCNRALGMCAHLQKLRAEVLPVLLWESPARHLGPEVIILAVATAMRVMRLKMHARRLAEG